MMREPIELPRRLWRLMDGHLNGTISDADMEELESLVLNNDMAARTFFDYARLHAELHLLAAAQVSVAKARAKEFGQAAQPQTGTSHPQPSRSRPAASKSPVLGFLHNLLHVGPDTPSAAALSWLVMALCTGIALAALVGIVLVVRGMHVPADAPESQIADHKSEIHLPSPALPPAPSGAVAHLIHTADCRWADEAEAPQVGADLRAGRKLALKSGLVEILFESGARTVLEGPATLEVSSRRSALLRRGKLTATVEDPSARGFAICTAGMKFTDLGTEFGVLVKQDGMQEVHVFRGKVQADRDADAERPVSPLVLTVNQAIRITGPNKPFERIDVAHRRSAVAAVVRASRPESPPRSHAGRGGNAAETAFPSDNCGGKPRRDCPRVCRDDPTRRRRLSRSGIHAGRGRCLGPLGLRSRRGPRGQHQPQAAHDLSARGEWRRLA